MANSTSKVLIVDDYAENLTALEALLMCDGLDVLKARSAREALEIVLAHDVAVALIDVQMPDIDGFELAQLMRGTERTRQIPIVFITASTHNSQRLFNGYSLGAVDFIFKPVEPHILKTKVDVFVELCRQRQQIAEQLEQQTEILRLNQLLMAVIAHDLGNPLHSISTAAALMLQKAYDEQVARWTAGHIRSSAVRMKRMIDDLLDFSSARLTGGLSMNPAGTNLLEIAKRVASEHQAGNDAVAINVSAAGDLEGTWDELRLSQTMSNLIGNALNHGDRSEPVSVLLDGSDPAAVVISVHNKGHIPEAFLPQIFDPFKSFATSKSAHGRGLGLYIVADIVKTHGGSLSVDSKSESGTRFTIKLPRHVAGTLSVHSASTKI